MEEDKINDASADAEVVADKEAGISEEDKGGKNPAKKIDFRFELALFLILGFLLGVVIKTEAVKRVTIGYNDNAVQSVKQAYDFEKIKKDIAEKSSAQEQAPQGGAVPGQAGQ